MAKFIDLIYNANIWIHFIIDEILFKVVIPHELSDPGRGPTLWFY